MAVVAELQEQIMEALADGEQKTKPQLAKQIPDLSGAHLASALRVLKREGPRHRRERRQQTGLPPAGRTARLTLRAPTVAPAPADDAPRG